MEKVPTIKEYWSLSRLERMQLYKETGISGTYLRDFWQPYKSPDQNISLERILSIRGVKQEER